jgi:1-acyl-sn-glycerol-3-phosphate acyltransferase
VSAPPGESGGVDLSAVVVPHRGGAYGTSVPPRPSWVYSLSHWVVKPLLKALFKMRFVSRDRLPESGPVIIAGNHLSYMDPLMICIAEPRTRPVHFMAKIELFNHGAFFNWLLRMEHGFPVHRGQVDRDSIVTASDILKRGGVVGIFPEGTRIRGGKQAEGQEGAAFLAVRTGALVVPVGICGSDRIQPPGDKHWHYVPLTAFFGEPIDPGAFEGGRKERVAAMTAAIMAGIDDAKRSADCTVR